MSITTADQAEVSIFGMRDSRLYDDVAQASRKAVELGATVVSSLGAPQIRAVFNDITQAAAFAIWLSRRLVGYHTYQLTQVAAAGALPWPARDAERVWKNCAALARGEGDHARRWRVQPIDEAECNLIAEAIERTPLLTLTQESTLKAFRRPRGETARLKRRIRRLAHDRRILREEIGSLLDLVPMVNLAEGIPDATVRLVLQGQFLPHIAQLLVTCLVTFNGTNLVEWDVTDPHGRGAFLLTIQRKDGLSAMQLKRQAEEKTADAWTRLYDMLARIQDALTSYECFTLTLEEFIDITHQAIREAGGPIGTPLQAIVNDITAVMRKEDREDVAPHLLATRVGQAFAERSAARTLLDDPMVATALLRHPVLAELYAAYTNVRGTSGNTKENQEDGAAAQAHS